MNAICFGGNAQYNLLYNSSGFLGLSPNYSYICSFYAWLTVGQPSAVPVVPWVAVSRLWTVTISFLCDSSRRPTHVPWVTCHLCETRNPYMLWYACHIVSFNNVIN